VVTNAAQVALGSRTPALPPAGSRSGATGKIHAGPARARSPLAACRVRLNSGTGRARLSRTVAQPLHGSPAAVRYGLIFSANEIGAKSRPLGKPALFTNASRRAPIPGPVQRSARTAASTGALVRAVQALGHQKASKTPAAGCDSTGAQWCPAGANWGHQLANAALAALAWSCKAPDSRRRARSRTSPYKQTATSLAALGHSPCPCPCPPP
jgi:hypothetical protein